MPYPRVTTVVPVGKLSTGAEVINILERITLTEGTDYPLVSSVVLANELAGRAARDKPARKAYPVRHMRHEHTEPCQEPRERIKRERGNRDEQEVREHRHGDRALPQAEKPYRHDVRLRDDDEDGPRE